MIAIVDYGIGNVASVVKMFRRNGVNCLLVRDPSEIYEADKLILPGVGAFDSAMNKLNELNLVFSIKDFAASGKPLLGICLGAQLLMQSSEKGMLEGLGIITGTCRHFGDIRPLRVPHMNWSEVTFTSQHPLFSFPESDPRFYFTHSYYIECTHEADIAGTSIYGNTFTCATRHNNIFGIQLHSEKSHRFDARLFINFASL
jgi:glutamine amidotransferase